MTRPVVLALALFAGPAATSAALIPFHFTSTVTTLGPGTLPAGYEGVTVGMSFSYSFTLDTSVPDGHASPAQGIYSNAAKDVTLRIPALGINTNFGDSTFNVSDGVTPSQPDILRIDTPVTSAATLLFWMRVFDPASATGPSVLTNDDLPTTINPAVFTHTNFVGMYVPFGGQPPIFYGTATLVPEPTGMVVLPLVGAMLLSRRWRR